MRISFCFSASFSITQINLLAFHCVFRINIRNGNPSTPNKSRSGAKTNFPFECEYLHQISHQQLYSILSMRIKKKTAHCVCMDYEKVLRIHIDRIENVVAFQRIENVVLRHVFHSCLVYILPQNVYNAKEKHAFGYRNRIHLIKAIVQPSSTIIIIIIIVILFGQ